MSGLFVDSGQMAIIPKTACDVTKLRSMTQGISVVPLPVGTREIYITVDHADEDEAYIGSLLMSTDRIMPVDAVLTIPEGCDAVVFSDPCYVLGGDYGDGGTGYSSACDVTLSEPYHGLFDAADRAQGFVTSSGYGDGCYNMHISSRDDRVMCEVRFIS
jgi:hypothetical protein